MVAQILLGALLSGASFGMAGAQTTSRCEIAKAAVRPIRLDADRQVTVNAHSIEESGETVLLMGTPTLVWSRKSGRPSDDAKDSAAIGAEQQAHAPARLILAPDVPSGARYFRGVQGIDGWDVVFFVPDSAHVLAPSGDESGAIWYGHLGSAGWRDVHEIGPVHGADPRTETSSGLVRLKHDIYFAIGYGSPSGAGGVLLWHRDASRRWYVDSLSLPHGPLYVTMPRPEPSASLTVFAAATSVLNGRYYPASLYASAVTPGARLTPVLRTDGPSLMAPRVLMLERQRVVTWLQNPARRGDSTTLWFAVLDSTIDKPRTTRTLIVSGTSEYVAVPLRLRGAPAVLWLFRPGMRSDGLGSALLRGGHLVQLPSVSVTNEGYFAAASRGDGSIDLITAAVPKPGSADLPVSLLTNLIVNCERARQQ